MGVEADLIESLAAAGHSLATAESLTAGMLAARIADVPGASRVLRGGVVAYATEVKESVLGVPHDIVATHGVVSGECASAMASRVRDLLGASFGVSTTGVAGPDPQEDKPAGTVWIAAASDRGLVARELSLTGSRNEIREATCREALWLLAGILPREEPGLR